MSSIRVPEPVMSLALIPKASDQMASFTRALQRFQKEDPTFKVCGAHGSFLLCGVISQQPATTAISVCVFFQHTYGMVISCFLTHSTQDHLHLRCRYRFKGGPCLHARCRSLSVSVRSFGEGMLIFVAVFIPGCESVPFQHPQSISQRLLSALEVRVGLSHFA